MQITFKDGTTSEGFYVGLIDQRRRENGIGGLLWGKWRGGTNSLNGVLEYLHEVIHIGLYIKYGDAESVVKVYAISEINFIEP